jgi:hypothetical protein
MQSFEDQMSLLDTASAPPSKRRKSKKSKSKRTSQAEAERRRRQREQSQLQNWRAFGLPPPMGHNAPPVAPPIPRVIPWLEWCKLRGISLSTAERLARAGKVKVTYLSERRKGVREDHDREYLDSCLGGRGDD